MFMIKHMSVYPLSISFFLFETLERRKTCMPWMFTNQSYIICLINRPSREVTLLTFTLEPYRRSLPHTGVGGQVKTEKSGGTTAAQKTEQLDKELFNRRGGGLER